MSVRQSTVTIFAVLTLAAGGVLYGQRRAQGESEAWSPSTASAARGPLASERSHAAAPPVHSQVAPPSKQITDAAPSRKAAQRGLDFLVTSTKRWQAQHSCYGCHVQAVTLEALSVGHRNAYKISMADVKAIRDGMLHLSGGQRGPRGLSLRGTSLFSDSKTFGGMAFARYDELVDDDIADDLVAVAKALLKYQQEDGGYALDAGGHSPPVKAGPMQGTLHAMQTWRQAHSRTADEAWLAPIRKAEAYIQKAVESWGTPVRHDRMQDLNYALMGLAAAGAGRSEALASRLIDRILDLQNKDGGFAWRSKGQATRNGPSNAFATGQTLYALRAVGFTEKHPAVARATAWLVEHQRDDGRWSTLGSSKAEAMWAVLGLVGVDVVTIDVEGLVEGGRVDAPVSLIADVRSNEGHAVRSVTLYVDDRLVTTGRGSRLSYLYRPEGQGRRVLDFVATLDNGHTGRRRFEIYTGDVYLTDVGARFADGGTLISARNIAQTSDGSHVALAIRRVTEEGAAPALGKVVYETKARAQQGAVAFHWEDANGRGRRFFAELTFRDPDGVVRQTERVLFFHGQDAEQRRHFGEVSGQLRFGRSQKATANSVVELVNDEGQVVQRTRTTNTGSYRFKNVGSGRYRVRMNKRGFRAAEQQVQAKAGQDSKAAMTAW